jgi:CubicO group peptidase (beta-lactamase class C family)
MQRLSEFINEAMQEWKVPGLAIAIVKDSQIIFCEGFGKRDVEQNLSVTPQTLFAIASCTKPFTTMAMSILVERGLLDWDKPVRNYLPTFKLYDSYQKFGSKTSPFDKLREHLVGLYASRAIIKV